MRTLTVIGTGAKYGNCYLLDCDGEKLILDAGVKMADIKTALKWDITGIEGVLVSHVHTDHSHSESGFKKMGLPILAPYHTPEITFPKAVFGNFIVNSFPLPHDGTPNYGFLIRHKDFQMAYLTDLEFCRYKFQKQKLNCILVECNFVPELVDRDSENFEHIVKGHASLDVAEGIVKANATDALRNVILCHLSEKNADEGLMQSRIQAAVPDVTVSIAKKGEVISL